MNVFRNAGLAARVARVLGLLCLLGLLPHAQPQDRDSGSPTFEVASLKRSQGGQASITVSHGVLSIRADPLLDIVVWGYDVNFFQVVHPQWMLDERYDITAKAPSAVDEKTVRLMLQSLLADRLKLVVRREVREIEATAMTVGKQGTSLRPSGEANPSELQRKPGVAIMKQVTMTDFTRRLNGGGGRVVDMTGLRGRFDIELNFRPFFDESAERRAQALTQALEQAAEAQLGLKFVDRKIPVEVVVVVSAEKIPIAN